jgi:3-oxoacyl-[acyl-carrier protein] reductase
MRKGLNIVIIGAGRGIGFQVAEQLSSAGHNLFCISRNTNALEILRKESIKVRAGSGFHVLTLDISTVAGNLFDLRTAVMDVFPRVDILLNNAGLLINKDFSEFLSDEALQIFNINFFSAAAAIKELLPLMGGEMVSHIVNIGSMGGFQGSDKFHGLSYYSASKAALACLSECLAAELRDKNIRVNCLALGAAQTEMLEEAFPGYRAPLSAAQMAGFISQFMITGHEYFNGKVLPVSVSTP